MVLDDDQRRIAEAEPDHRQLVIAGPGAGKTEVVAALVGNLVGVHDVYADEILIVSFSRAAVHAVRQRLADAIEDAYLIEVRTLDSLAYELTVGDRDEMSGFDATVRAATKRLEEDGWQYLEQVRHVVVDEVQDVVGIRADFVRALLQRVDASCGFTLLGDPMQAVYDFQFARARKARRTRLLDSVGSDAAVGKHHLVNEYRSRSPDASRAASLRKCLAEATDDVTRRNLIQDFVADVVPMGNIETEGRLIDRWSGSTAVLCRDNIDVLRTAGVLRRAGLSVTIQRAASERSYAPWIAGLLGEFPTSTISRHSFLDLAGTAGLQDAELLWSALRRTAAGRGADLDLRALAAGLSGGRRQAELESSTDTSIVVSTVHRAKGLQFDNVVLVNADQWLRDDDAESVRVLFVGLTRSRDRLAVAVLEQQRGWFQAGRSERYFRRGREGWQTFGVEIRGSDTSGLGPTSASLTGGIGLPVSWQLDRDKSDLTAPVYCAVQGDSVVARTTSGFGEDFAARIGSAERRATPWPFLLEGAYVEALETVAGNPPASSGTGRHGLWLSTRVTGAVDLSWREPS
ncbi:UvrD-helicase domain-containing protein [Dactylosporangium sp. NPDC051541]|uniref:UvrD-helicase domain-containing protein n=1 Tax=Dactylosporangium sp. NPDC051541 TaxID=3363977 RepID=UPI00379E3C03